jgi:hypothetical protein
MRSVGIRSSVVAAVASIFVLSYGVTTSVHAQQAAAANPELAAMGVWDAGRVYAKYDIVTARGSAWISLRSGNTNRVPGETRRPTSRWWGLFARGFNPSGAWSNATEYQPDDLVTHNGQTYRAKITHTNRQPANTRFWELLVTRGAAGVAGAIGPQGPQGPQGPAGPNTGISGGTQAAPGISFIGDADTGIYSPQAGKIAMVGNGALFLHNFGSNNTALGTSALAANTTGTFNTALGVSALAVNTTGSSNVAVGPFALLANTAGNANTALGISTLAGNTTGLNNTAVGISALNRNTTGGDNSALGASALAFNTTGTYNVAVGKDALLNHTTGANNIAVGVSAAFNTNGSQNTVVGGAALAFNMTGSDNIAVGYNAGLNPTNPSNSIFIGNEGLSNDTTTIKIGTPGVQQSTFIAGIVEGGSIGDAQVFIDSATGQLGLGAPSSRTKKDDIETMADVTAMLGKLRPVTFRYKKPAHDGSRPLQYGLIAEEVAEVMPYLAAYNPDGTIRSVHYDRLPPFLLAGYQAQQKTIAAQTVEIGELKARLAAIEALLPLTKAAALQ